MPRSFDALHQPLHRVRGTSDGDRIPRSHQPRLFHVRSVRRPQLPEPGRSARHGLAEFSAEIMKTASWVVVRTSDKQAIFETFSKRTAEAINSEKYTAVPILEYLVSINGQEKL
jgi:hypothetical protein